MKELTPESLACRYRSSLPIVPGRYECYSSKLFVPAIGVTMEDCSRCYCRNHEPVEGTQQANWSEQKQIASLEVGIDRLKTCTKRGRVVKVGGKPVLREY